MDTSKPSPRPWATEHDTIFASNDEHVALALPIRAGRQYDHLIREANAQLIVTAVNQHDELLGLIRDMDDFIMGHVPGCEFGYVNNKECECGVRQVKERARKVLEAGGEG